MFFRSAGFIRANTRLLPVPLVPEVSLHMADEAVPLWSKTEEELGEAGLPPPFWAFAWAGGQALARWVLDHPETVAGRTVLSFAAGAGLEAIAAVKAGATRVLATEIDPFALVALELNAGMNGVSIGITGTDVLETGLAGLPFRPDVVLLGDVFFERPLADRVAAFAAACVAAGIEKIGRAHV